MKFFNFFYKIGLIVFAIWAVGCTPSRNIIASGKVTPKGAFKVGANSTFNIGTASVGEIDDVIKAAADEIKNKDTIIFRESANLKTLTRGLLAYSLDPVAPSSDFYVRYGLAERVDVGYKFASGAHVFDAMYQFMGSTGTPDNPGKSGLYGSIGLQYSGQRANLPSALGLDRISPIFSYELSRKDILVPLVFSQSFGPEEQYGNFSWGLVYGHTFIKYGFKPGKLYTRLDGDRVIKINDFMARENFSSYGGFINAKIGFKYVYLVPSLSIYYQDFGTYDFFGEQQESYKGMSFIPSIGLQANLGYGKKRR